MCRTERWRARRSGRWRREVTIERIPDLAEPCYRDVGVERERVTEENVRELLCEVEHELELLAGREYVIEYVRDGVRCRLVSRVAD